MNLAHLIIRPIITEKSLKMASQHKYTFAVAKQASKPQIKKAMTEYFSVKVLDIKTITVSGKRKRRPGRRNFIQTADWKKAIIQIPDNQTIDLFEMEEDNTTKKTSKKTNKSTKSKNSDQVTKQETQSQTTQKPTTKNTTNK